MNDIIKKHMGIETPRESAETVDRLADMDKDQGIFGEDMLDEELEKVAGGMNAIIPTNGDGCNWTYCVVCNTYFKYRAVDFKYGPPSCCSETCRLKQDR